MLWLIAVLVIGLIGIIGYRYYTNPPLSRTAKLQKENYIQRFRWGKTLIYQLTPDQQTILVEYLGKHYFNAGSGCFYRNNVVIYLQAVGIRTSIHLFCATEDELTRCTWQLTRLRNHLGGTRNAPTYG